MRVALLICVLLAQPASVWAQASPDVLAHRPISSSDTALQVSECASGSLDAEAITAPPYQPHRLHDIATGEGQIVAVIDTGVNPHPWLENLQGGGDFIASSNGLKDCDGHGTIVAGIIAAHPQGISPQPSLVGIAPDATLISIRHNSAHYRRSSPIGDVESMRHAVLRAAHLGARVINISQNVCTDNPTVIEELAHSLAYVVDTYDAVIIASSGHVGEAGCPTQPTLPAIPSALDDQVLSVAATPNGQNSPVSYTGSWTDITAPGTHIHAISVDENSPLHITKLQPGNRSIEGSSFAAAYVSATAALIRERFPDKTAPEIIARIKNTAYGAESTLDPTHFVPRLNPYAALTSPWPHASGKLPQTHRATLTPSPQITTRPALVATLTAVTALSCLIGLGRNFFQRHSRGQRRAGDE